MRLIILLIAVCCTAACHADPMPELIGETRTTSPAPDAGHPDGGLFERLLDEREQTPPPLADVPFDAGMLREDEGPWRAAQAFRYEQKSSGQLGSDTLWFDDTGHVHFRATAYVSRPGSYDLAISTELARELYDAVIGSGFLQMRDRYVDEQDGCQFLTFDWSNVKFSLAAGAHVKHLDYYQGCFAELPELDTLEALLEHVRKTLPLDALLMRPEPSACFEAWRAQSADPPYELSYVLQDAQGQPAGVLSLERFTEDLDPLHHLRWQTTDCAGTVLSSGPLASLRSCDSTLLTDEDATFAWPGIDHPISAVLMSQTPKRGLSLRLLQVDGESPRLGTVGDRCD